MSFKISLTYFPISITVKNIMSKYRTIFIIFFNIQKIYYHGKTRVPQHLLLEEFSSLPVSENYLLHLQFNGFDLSCISENNCIYYIFITRYLFIFVILDDNQRSIINTHSLVGTSK